MSAFSVLIFRCVAGVVVLSVAAPMVSGQDKVLPAAPVTKGAGEPARSADPRLLPPVPGAAYEGPSAAVLRVLQGQSREELAKLAIYLAEHRLELDAMSDPERADFFSKEIARAPEGEAVTVAQKPAAEPKSAFQSLSVSGQEKLRRLFIQSREKLLQMDPDERKEYVDRLYEIVAEQERVGNASAAPKK